MAYNLQNMSGVEIWKVEEAGQLSLSQPLADGRTLTWTKKPVVLGGLSEYSIRISLGKADQVSYSDLFMFVELKGQQILLINLGVIGGRAALGFDGSGAMVRLLVSEPQQKLWLDYNFALGELDYWMDPDDQYLTDDKNGYEIREKLGNDCLLGINFLGEDAFLVKSVRWKPNFWLVSNQPIGPEQLAVFSPDHWGRRDKAELMAATVDQIISQRVSPMI